MSRCQARSNRRSVAVDGLDSGIPGSDDLTVQDRGRGLAVEGCRESGLAADDRPGRRSVAVGLMVVGAWKSCRRKSEA